MTRFLTGHENVHQGHWPPGGAMIDNKTKRRIGIWIPALLVGSFALACGESLGDLFDAWLYDAAVPDIPEMGLSGSGF